MDNPKFVHRKTLKEMVREACADNCRTLEAVRYWVKATYGEDMTLSEAKSVFVEVVKEMGIVTQGDVQSHFTFTEEELLDVANLIRKNGIGRVRAAVEVVAKLLKSSPVDREGKG